MEQPNRVYKYQKFNDLSLNTLVFDQLFFSSPESFNDPLDCQPYVDIDSDLKELREILKALMQKRLKSENLALLNQAKIKGVKAQEHANKVSEQEISIKLDEIAYFSTNPDLEIERDEAEINQLRFEIQSELLMQYDRGICCFSTEYDNPLLWSHYADQHKGFCAGYSLERSPRPNLMKVDYGGTRKVLTSSIKRSVIDSESVFREKIDNDVLLRKAPPWEYEKEWRLLGDIGLHDSPLALVDITFGVRCPTSVIHSVVSALGSRDKPINFYSICIQGDSFLLTREKLCIESIQFLPRVSRSGQEMFGDIQK